MGALGRPARRQASPKDLAATARGEEPVRKAVGLLFLVDCFVEVIADAGTRTALTTGCTPRAVAAKTW